MSRCIITGCALVHPVQTQMQVWGDLHEQGDQYIFNACLTDEGEAAWNNQPFSKNAKALLLQPMANWFERRGIFVVDKVSAKLNDAAAEYLKR